MTITILFTRNTIITNYYLRGSIGTIHNISHQKDRNYSKSASTKKTKIMSLLWSKIGFSNSSLLSGRNVVGNKTSIISSLWSSMMMNHTSNYLFTSLRLKSGIKTNSGAKKRFRVRGSGSIKRYDNRTTTTTTTMGCTSLWIVIDLNEKKNYCSYTNM
jgi:hypothetical protein